MSVKNNLAQIYPKIEKAKRSSPLSSSKVTLIAVSKLQPDEAVKEGIEAGIVDLGENYVQELLRKKQDFSNENLYWHLIGPLQSNKVKQIVGEVDLIHTVDRLSLAEQISKAAEQKNIIQKILIQVNVSGEESKSGCALNEYEALLAASRKLKHIKVVGLMTMPPFAEDPEHSRPYFKKMRELFIKDKELLVLSMGTSQDFEIAIEEGATHVRVGSLVFGERG